MCSLYARQCVSLVFMSQAIGLNVVLTLLLGDGGKNFLKKFSYFFTYLMSLWTFQSLVKTPMGHLRFQQVFLLGIMNPPWFSKVTSVQNPCVKGWFSTQRILQAPWLWSLAHLRSAAESICVPRPGAGNATGHRDGTEGEQGPGQGDTQTSPSWVQDAIKVLSKCYQRVIKAVISWLHHSWSSRTAQSSPGSAINSAVATSAVL